MNAGIALFVVLAAIAASGAAFAQASLPAPEIDPPAVSAAPPTETSAWDAPEPWRTDRFYLATSLYTRHRHYDPAHDNHQDLIQGE
ncbi:MAG: hypothetical protein ABI648_12695 [Betaproteobacteria bacterium]